MNSENNNTNFSPENTSYQKSKQLSIEIIKICQQIMKQKDYTILSPLM